LALPAVIRILQPFTVTHAFDIIDAFKLKDCLVEKLSICICVDFEGENEAFDEGLELVSSHCRSNPATLLLVAFKHPFNVQ
jgi:hypothetical protein